MLPNAPLHPSPALTTPLQDHDHAYVRVTFNFGGSYDPFIKFPAAVFLKELSFRSADIKHANRMVQEIKMLRSTTQQRDKERAERAGLVAQERLVQGARGQREGWGRSWKGKGGGGRGAVDDRAAGDILGSGGIEEAGARCAGATGGVSWRWDRGWSACGMEAIGKGSPVLSFFPPSLARICALQPWL